MKKLYIVFGILSVLLFTPNVFAQEAAVMWVLNNTTQLTSLSAGNVTGSAESLSSGSGQFGMSVFDYSQDGQRLWEGTAGWIAGTEEATRYIQFDALPVSGNSFTVSNVAFNYGAAGIDNNIQSNAYYSTDGWVTRTLLNSSPLIYPASTMSLFSQNVSVTIASGSTFSLRIYPYAVINSSPMRPAFAVHNSVGIRGTTGAKKNCVIQITDVTSKWGKSVVFTAKLFEPGITHDIDLPDQELKLFKIYTGDSGGVEKIYTLLIGSGTTDANGVASVMYTIPSDSVSYKFDPQPSDSVLNSIRVEFAGDANYNAQSGMSKLIIVKHVTSLVVAPTTAVLGQEVLLSATLTDNDENGKGVSNQELKFYKISPGTREGDTVETYINSGKTDANGFASLIYFAPMDSVTYSIKVLFAGDANYSAQSDTGKFTYTTVIKKNCVIQGTDLTSKWGKSVVLTARLQESGLIRNTDLPNQEVKFYKISPGTREGDTVEAYINFGKTDANGVASVMYTIPSDSVAYKFDPQPSDSVLNSIRVEFAGDANYNAQSGISKLIIVKHVTNLAVAPTTAVLGQSVVLTATLTDNDDNGKGVFNQELKFYKISPGTREGDTAKVYVGSDSTDANGVAIISYTLPQDSVASTHTITAVYTGDANYSPQSGTGTLTYTLTGVENNQANIPTKFALTQNYPNPFNPTSTIRYDIPKTSFVKISVYDILGKEIKVLVNEEKNPGHHEIIYDARELASGIYFYTIRTAEFTQSKKMILLK
ncbi:MAG: T9SS type A sorting domain-containing protein [Ignavibacteriaceae bacterium]|jgi:hypothetical protein